MLKQLKQVEEFHKAFKIYRNTRPIKEIPASVFKLRLRIMQEELDEYAREMQTAGSPDERLQAVAKELADITYTLFGTIVSHGLQNEFEKIFDAVHESNMSKLDADGNPIYRADGKVMKSPLYREPDLRFLHDHRLESKSLPDSEQTFCKPSER